VILRSASIVVLRLLIIAAAALTWELLSRFHVVSPRFLPALSDVATTLWAILQRPDTLTDIGITLSEVAAGFSIAVLIGTALGACIAESRYLAITLKPLLFFLLSIPKAIFLPLFILAVGIGMPAKIAFGAFSGVFVVVMNTAAAVESVRQDHITAARAWGASRPQIFRYIYLPSMLPVMLETLRLTMIFNFTGVVLAEMYASRSGLGFLIVSWGENFQMRQLLAGVLLVGTLAIIINETIRWIEARCSHWRT
jgi:NitT/TauT family transport system permease protein